MMQYSHSQVGCFLLLARQFLCWPAWHWTQIWSVLSIDEYFFDWSKPNPPSWGPTMICIRYSILYQLFSIIKVFSFVLNNKLGHNLLRHTALWLWAQDRILHTDMHLLLSYYPYLPDRPSNYYLLYWLWFETNLKMI